MKRLIIIILICAATLTAQRINLQPRRTSFPSDSLNLYTIVGDGGDVSLEQVPFGSLKTFLADSGLVSNSQNDTITYAYPGPGYTSKYSILRNIYPRPEGDTEYTNYGSLMLSTTLDSNLANPPSSYIGVFQTARNNYTDDTLHHYNAFTGSLTNYGRLNNSKLFAASASNADTVSNFLYGYYTFLNQSAWGSHKPYAHYYAHLRLKSQNWNVESEDLLLMDNVAFLSGWHWTEGDATHPAETTNIRGVYFNAYNSGAGATTENVTGFWSEFDNDGTLENFTQFKAPTLTGDGDFTGDYIGMHLEAQPEFAGLNYGILDEMDSSKFVYVIQDSTQIGDSVVTDTKIAKALTVDKGTAGQIAMSNGGIGVSFQNTIGKAYLENVGSLAFDWDDNEVADDLTINTTKNVQTNGNWLSYDGNDEGIKVRDNGYITFGNNSSEYTGYMSQFNYALNNTDHTGMLLYPFITTTASNYSGKGFWNLQYFDSDYDNATYKGMESTINTSGSGNNIKVIGFNSLVSTGNDLEEVTVYKVDNSIGGDVNVLKNIEIYTLMGLPIDVNTYYGVKDSLFFNRSATINTRYGYYIASIGKLGAATPTVVDNYALYIPDQTVSFISGDNYAIYAEGPKSYIENIETNQLKLNGFVITDIDTTADGRFYKLTDGGGEHFVPRYTAADTSGVW